MNKLTLILCFVSICLVLAVPKRDRNDYKKNSHRVVCYYASWSHYRKVDAYDVENIDINLCTHLNYAFAKLNDDTLEIEMGDQWADEHQFGFQRFNNLRQKNPNLTTMLSVGGWKEGSQKFSDMTKSTKLRQDFVKSIVEFLKKYDFDGLDLDWEFPAVRKGSSEANKQDLILLLEELRTAFNPLGYVLTVAISPAKVVIDKAYNMTEINKLADWINLLAYEYHSGTDKQIGHNSPLYHRPEEVDELYSTANVNFSVNYIIEKGADPEKIVLGMTFYGTGYTLVNSTQNKLHDIADGPSPAGPISGEKGYYGYNEICQLTKDITKWSHKRDTYYKAPFTYDDKLWIGYDDVNSIACKSSYIKTHNISGAAIWGLGFDDFRDRCGGGVTPLLNKVHSLLNGVSKNLNECKI